MTTLSGCFHHRRVMDWKRRGAVPAVRSAMDSLPGSSRCGVRRGEKSAAGQAVDLTWDDERPGPTAPRGGATRLLARGRAGEGGRRGGRGTDPDASALKLVATLCAVAQHDLQHAGGGQVGRVGSGAEIEPSAVQVAACLVLVERPELHRRCFEAARRGGGNVARGSIGGLGVAAWWRCVCRRRSIRRSRTATR